MRKVKGAFLKAEKKIENMLHWSKHKNCILFPLLVQPYADVSLTVVVVVDRLLREHAMIVEVQVYARNAMVKDLCSRDCPMKVLKRQDWWQKTQQLDTQQGRLSYRSLYPFLHHIAVIHVLSLSVGRLPKKWSYCMKCSSARSCALCGGSGKLSCWGWTMRISTI